MTNQEIRKKLLESAEDNYRNFSASLIPGCDKMIGVRIPKLRLIAKEIAKGNYKEYLKNAVDDSFEEVMIQGLVIGYIKADIDEVLEYVKEFVPKISNWSINDCFCSTLKIVKKNRDTVWNFMQQYLNSDKEFELRFLAIMLMDYYIEDEYVDKVIEILDSIHNDGYYLKMGVAWALASIYSNYPELVYMYLKEKSNLDNFTYNKAIQKTIESYRVSDNDKKMLKNMKRK